MSLISSLKASVRGYAPRMYAWLQRRCGIPPGTVGRRRLAGRDVAAGPFRGMRMGNAVSGSYVPKLIGSYEEELHPVIEEILGNPPAFDVGRGEGYYLVGLARRLPNLMCIGFDTNVSATDACRELAAINEVSRQVDVRLACDHKTLSRLPLETAVVIVD